MILWIKSRPSLRQRECFAKVTLTIICGDIFNTHTTFKLLLHEIAKCYEQAAYLEWILNERDDTLSVLLQKLSEVANRIKA